MLNNSKVGPDVFFLFVFVYTRMMGVNVQVVGRRLVPWSTIYGDVGGKPGPGRERVSSVKDCP